MSVAEVAKLSVRMSLDDSQFNSKIRGLNGKLAGLGPTARRAGGLIGKGLVIGAGAGIVALSAALKAGTEALRQDKVVAAQTAAVIKSTGGAAGVTASQVETLSARLSDLLGVQDDVVQGAQNMLLTYTNIGAATFPRATEAVLDMSAALGTDANNAALQLGKALQDPIKGIARLTRLGITFTDKQKKQIEGLVKQGKLYDAQAIILGEVEKKFKGVALAQAEADPSRRLAVGIEKFQKALATGLLPVVEKIQRRLTEWIIKPSTLATVEKIGNAIAGLFTDQNLDTIATGLETAANAVGTAIGLFNKLPPEIKALAIGAFAINKVTGGAVGGAAEAFGKLIGAGLKSIFAANVTVIGKNVIGGGGIPGGGTPGVPAAAAGASALSGIAAAAAIVATPIIMNNIIPELFRGAPGSGAQATQLQGGAGTINQQTAAMFQGLMPGWSRMAAEAGSKSVVPELQGNESTLQSGIAALGADTRSEGIMTRREFGTSIAAAAADTRSEGIMTRRAFDARLIANAGQAAGDAARAAGKIDETNRRLSGVAAAVAAAKVTNIALSVISKITASDVKSSTKAYTTYVHHQSGKAIL